MGCETVLFEQRGGTAEVLKNMIAQHVLGLPRAKFPGFRALAH